MVVGVGSAQQAVAAGWSGAPALGPVQALVKAKPTKAPRGFTVRLPDGRTLRFTYAPAPGAGSHRPPTGDPSSGDPDAGDPGTGTPPSGGPSDPGTPSASSSTDPSVSGLPVPVVSSLFPSSGPSGSGDRTTSGSRPSHGAAAAQPSSSTSVRSTPGGPAQDGAGAGAGSGADAVAPEAVVPERPASTVPPPLGPQALLHPGAATEQIAVRTADSGGLGPRARLLGVGLALIGAGAALFGWRIRRL